MFTLKELQGVLATLYGAVVGLPILLLKQFIEFTLAPQPYLFRWGDAYDN